MGDQLRGGTTIGGFIALHSGLDNAYLSGNLTVNKNLTVNQAIISTIATGTAPFTVTSTTMISHLNADMLDDKHATDFAASTHISVNADKSTLGHVKIGDGIAVSSGVISADVDTTTIILTGTSPNKKIAHADTSTITGAQGTAGIATITIDGMGHVTGVTPATYLTTETDTLESVTTRGASTDNAISITNNTASSSASTGALIVTGGTGIGGNLYVGGNLTLTGDLTLNGTTTTVNSTITTLDDPIITLGGDTAPTSDDNKDRGIEFRWHNGTVAKIGFFGFDDSTGKFTFIPDATNTSEVFSGTVGTIDAKIDWSNIVSPPSSYAPNVNNFGTVSIATDSGYTWSAVNTNTSQIADSTSDTLTLVNGSGISLYASTVAATDAIKIEHADTSSVANLSSDNSGNTFIQDISFTFDTFGHVTAASVVTGTATFTQSNDFGKVSIAADSGYTWGTKNVNTDQTADAIGDTLTLVPGTGINLYANTVVANDAVKIENAGVLTFQTSLSGLLPSAATAGAVTLSGTLGVTSGGTGTSTAPTAKGVIYASSASAYTSTAAGSSGQTLVVNSSGVPAWTTLDMTYVPDSAFKKSVKAASTANLTVTATTTTLTNAGTKAAFSVDSISFAVGDRVLIKDQTTNAQNGIYTVTTLGDAATNWVLTRAASADSSSEIAGGVVNIDQGSQGGFLWSNNFKTTDTLGTTGMPWYRVYSTYDSDIAPTVNKLALRDSSGYITAVGYKYKNTLSTAILGGDGSTSNAGNYVEIRPFSTSYGLILREDNATSKWANLQVDSVARPNKLFLTYMVDGTATANKGVDIDSVGNLGVSGNVTGSGDITISGTLYAASKSFLIPHPTKEGVKLRYGSLEGPENGVYVRGRLKDNDTIELPDYWIKLIDPNSITVQLTPIGEYQKLYVKDIVDNKVIVGNKSIFKKINCFYTITAERIDVDKLQVEI